MVDCTDMTSFSKPLVNWLHYLLQSDNTLCYAAHEIVFCFVLFTENGSAVKTFTEKQSKSRNVIQLSADPLVRTFPRGGDLASYAFESNAVLI